MIGHLKVTDAKTRVTTEFVALLDVEMLTATINQMFGDGIPHMEFLEGMLVVVSRPVMTA